MKNTRIILAAIASHAIVTTNSSAQTYSSGDWIKPIVDIRTRYEYGDFSNRQASNAATVRARLGFQTKAWNGLSLLADSDITRALVDDYSGGAPGADPFDAKKTPIGDPETTELNQLYLQYENWDTMLRAGRQRIKYDNDAFVGNVGWRQNEQTYDAFSIENKSINGLTLNYAYVGQVNRIFGSDADAPITASNVAVEDYDSSSHFFHATYTGIEGITLGGYVYIMDFEDIPSYDNNTVGMTAKKDMFGLSFYGEVAFQGEAGVNNDKNALYFHTTATKTMGTHALTLGCEYLESGFKTPLATLHAFNGFADVFINQRASGGHNGITDTYLTHSMPLFWGMKFINTVHIMGDNELSAGYGWEYDSVISKKFNKNFTAISKLGWFNSEGDVLNGSAAIPDATRYSIELNYVF